MKNKMEALTFTEATKREIKELESLVIDKLYRMQKLIEEVENTIKAQQKPKKWIENKVY